MKMNRNAIPLLLTLGLLVGGAALPASGDEAATTTPPPPAPPPQQAPEKAEQPKKHPILMYIPNRIFDALDIVRARVRLGPGLSVGARVTSIATVFVGGHSTAYVGVPGPRGKPEIPLPFGIEDSAGPMLAPAKESEEEAARHPYYGPMEIGAEAQVAIVGFSVGVEPLEALDFLAGIFFIDLKGDDY